MKGIIYTILIASLLMLASCTKNEAESQQSIQDIVSDTKDFKNVANETKIPEKPKVINATKREEVEITNETPEINRKCRNSSILYDGCKWKDGNETTFTLRIISASKTTIPGVWFIITGESGGVNYVKRPESILSKGTRSYTIDYAKLVKEIGEIKRFEVLPIEVTNGTEYACLNQHVYTIPATYCKPSEPVKVD